MHRLQRASPRSAGSVVLVLTLAMAVAVMPIGSLAVLAPILTVELDISTGQIGLLIAVASASSALLAPRTGRLVDRIGDRNALLGVLAAGALCLTAMAVAAGFVGMLFAVAIGGLCRAAANPATNRFVSTRVPAGRRGFVTGIKHSGETGTTILIAGALPTVALLLGWRAALLVLAGVAVAALGIAAACIRGSGATAPSAAARGPLRGSIYWLTAYTVAMGAAGTCMTGYLPLYAHEVGHFSVTAAGFVVAAAGLIATLSRVLWGHLAERRLGIPAALRTLASIAVVATVLLILAPRLGSGAYWAAAVLWGASGLTFGAVSNLAVIVESAGVDTGRGSGMTGFGFGLGAMIASPIFGWLVESGPGYEAGFVLVAACYAIGAGVIAVGQGRFRVAPAVS
jgi:predicted MFS family arabinose efflux permease